MDKNLQLIKDFVERRIDADAIKQYCYKDLDFRTFVRDLKDNPLRRYKNSFLNFIENAKLNLPTNQLVLYLVFTNVLYTRNIEFVDTNYYIEQAQKYCEVIPNWLPDSASDWVEENILNKMPEGLSDAQKKKWMKSEVEKVYPCEKKHPSWVQGTEDWPQDEDGNNLTFVKQRERGEEVTYTFVNPKTKETVEVVEFY